MVGREGSEAEEGGEEKTENRLRGWRGSWFKRERPMGILLKVGVREWFLRTGKKKKKLRGAFNGWFETGEEERKRLG